MDVVVVSLLERLPEDVVADVLGDAEVILLRGQFRRTVFGFRVAERLLDEEILLGVLGFDLDFLFAVRQREFHVVDAADERAVWLGLLVEAAGLIFGRVSFLRHAGDDDVALIVEDRL